MKNSYNIRRRAIYFLIFAAYVFWTINIFVPAKAQEIYFPEKEQNSFTFPMTWNKLPETEHKKTLSFLCSCTDGNKEKIRTLRCNYFVQFSQGLFGEVAKEIGKIEGITVNDYILEDIDFDFILVSDFKSNKFFRERTIKNCTIKAEQKEIQPKVIKIESPISILSDRDYLYTVKDNIIPDLRELMEFPETKNKKVVWREPPENVKNSGISNMIDPCEYFDNEKWGNIEHLLRSKQDNVFKNIALFESTDSNGSKWFRLYRKLAPDSQPYIEVNVFWYEKMDYMPVYLLITNEKHAPINSLQVQWKKYNNVNFPTFASIVVNEDSGQISYRRKMTLNDIEINQPIDSKQFSYSALGLGDGDILVDQIKHQVFTIQNDQPVYLAKFYEKYQTPSEQNTNRVRIAIMLLGFVLIAIGIYISIRRRMIEKNKNKEKDKDQNVLDT